jgi:energy-converting hydrogenase Eha subunit E
MISFERTTGQAPLDAVSSGCIIGSLCEIHPDACLTFIANGTINTLVIGGAVILTEA